MGYLVNRLSGLGRVATTNGRAVTDTLPTYSRGFVAPTVRPASVTTETADKAGAYVSPVAPVSAVESRPGDVSPLVPQVSPPVALEVAEAALYGYDPAVWQAIGPEARARIRERHNMGLESGAQLPSTGAVSGPDLIRIEPVKVDLLPAGDGQPINWTTFAVLGALAYLALTRLGSAPQKRRRPRSRVKRG